MSDEQAPQDAPQSPPSTTEPAPAPQPRPDISILDDVITKGDDSPRETRTIDRGT
jgi:hypothetical protein